jgi:catechol 2,3-dioxygenase-like lactoylglutathione lyase family enzyme
MRIGLITILTNEIEPMEKFYREILGFKVVENLGNYIEFENEGARFAICTRDVMATHTGHESYSQSPRGQSFELAFPVGSPEDVDRIFDELVKKGTTPVKPPEMMPWGRKTGFISDPDGNIHEIYSIKTGETV